jgi:hypothetical protein
MSQDTNGIVNLDYIVNRVLMDLDDPTMRYYKKYLQYAIDGYMDLNLYTMQNIKVAYLPVKENKTVDLPSDYIDYTKIGFNQGGSIGVFSVNNDLILPRDTDDCGNVVNDNTGDCNPDDLVFPNYGYYFAPHYRNGQYVGELYSGIGNFNPNGKYRIDLDRRQIAFNSDVTTDTVILEYKSSGVSGDGSTNVPRQCVPALVAFVHWKRREYNDKVAQGTKDSLMNRYYTEFEKLRYLEFSFTVEEYFDSRRSTYSSIPKR